jgi:hypothetical protein
MRFSRYTFLAAGTIGILVLAPMYFLMEKIGTDNPPPINHLEFYYGFIGVALAFQLVFLIIATDPIKFRPFMLAAIFEKFAFVIPTFYLYFKGRTTGSIVGGAALDLMWGVLFAVSYFKTTNRRSR